MFLSSLVTLVCALAVACLAHPLKPNPRVNYGNANLAVDLFLIKVNRGLPDQLPIPDIGGKFNLQNCFMLGTANGIHREGDATLLIDEDVAKFVVGLTMTDVGVVCEWREHLIHGTVTSTTPQLSISAGAQLLLESGEHPWLTDFHVTTMEDFDSEVTGFVGMNWAAEAALNQAVNDAKEDITFYLELGMQEQIQHMFNDMVVP